MKVRSLMLVPPGATADIMTDPRPDHGKPFSEDRRPPRVMVDSHRRCRRGDRLPRAHVMDLDAAGPQQPSPAPRGHGPPCSDELRARGGEPAAPARAGHA